MTNPKALSITMVMGHVVAVLLFGTLFVMSLVFEWGIFAIVIFAVILGLTLYNLYKYLKFQIKTGSIFDNTSIYDMLWSKK